MSPEAHDALQVTKGELEAEAPEGAAPDRFAAEDAAKAAGSGHAGKKAKKKGGKKAEKK